MDFLKRSGRESRLQMVKQGCDKANNGALM